MLKEIIKGATCAVLAALVFNANATVVYSNDFQSAATGITGFNTIQTANAGQKFIGYMTGGATSNLALSGLAAHTSVTLDFDVYGLRSLDGGNDAFTLYVNNLLNFSDSYAHLNRGSNSQTGFNVIRTSGGTSNGVASATNANFGVGCFWACEQTYHYSMTFADSNAAISFGFKGQTDQGWADEAFGLDNITVSTNAAQVPEPTSIALLGLGMLGLVAARRRKQ